MALLRLFDPVNQFQTKSGALNTAGLLRVYLNGTDDYAAVHDDNGTLLEQPVRLDNNGRAPGLFVDSGKVYRLEVQDRYGSLLFTVMNMVPSGGGAGSSLGDRYDVVSSDGSISVDRSVDAGTTTYDIGLAPNDSDEFLEWIKCSENECGATWYPVFNDGSMETEAGKGIKVHGGHLYHFTNSFTVDPDGTGVNYDTFRVAMYCGDDIVDEHDFDIDSSLNDQVLCEFSRDVVPSKDTHVYFKLTIPTTCKASGEVQCHRIYSGINAVPDTCATKQWVSRSYQPLSGMSSYVPYSSVGNNSMGQVTGINGSAIAGGLDSASVSSIASSVASAYTESAMGAYATTAYVDGMVSGKLDTSVFASASAGFQPTGDYAFNSSLSSYIPASASGAFQPSGDYAFNSAVSSKLDASATTSWIPYSALGYSGTSISSIGGSSLAGMGGGGVTGDYVEKSSMEVAIGSRVTALKTAFAQGNDCSASEYSFAQGYRNSADNDSFAQGSSNIATSNSFAQGHWNTATKASLAHGSYNTATNNSFAQGYSNTATNTSFAQGENNSANSYSFAQGIFNSASSNSFAQGIRNSAAYTVAVFGSYNLRGNGSTYTGDSAAFAIGDGTADSARHDLMLVTKNGEITMYSSTADTVGLGLVSSIKAISASATGGVYSATVSAIASAYAESAASGKLDNSASSMFQPSGKYQTAGDYAYNSSVSSKLDASASSQFAPSGNYADKSALSSYVPVSASGQFAPSGDYAYNSALNGKQDTLAFAYNTADQISSINGSALGGMDEAAVSAIASSYAQSAASGKLDSTAFNSGDFYSTSNPSGFVGSAYVDSSVSGKLDTTAFASASAGFQPTGDYAYNSALTAYIPASASGAFQPSGDYAFNSAVSSKLDSSASGDFVMNTAMTSWIPYVELDYSGTVITGIGGSSLVGMGGGTGDYVEKSATEVAIGSGTTAFDTAFAQGVNCSASADSFAQGFASTADLDSFAQGARNTASFLSFAQGSYNAASSISFAQGHHNTATDCSFAQGENNSANLYSFAQGDSNSANLYSFAQGDGNSATNTSFAHGGINSANSYSFAQGVGNSAVYHAAVFGMYNLHGNGDTATGDSAAFAIGNGTAATARHDLMLVTKNGEITMFSSTADTVGTGIMSSIRAISAAASGGVDSAAVSAIASSYAQSAASGKLDSTAFNSGDFYSTSNPSGFITGVDLTPYQPTSAMSGYIPTSMSSDFQQVAGMSSYALSADVSATVDLVGTQSANWGGSALQLSAGPGISLMMVDNILVISTAGV